MTDANAVISSPPLDRGEHIDTDINTRLMTAFKGVGDALVVVGGAVKNALAPRDGDTALDVEGRIVAFTSCLQLAASLPTEAGGPLTRQLTWFGNMKLPVLLDRAFRLGDRRWVEDQFDHGERLWDPLLAIQDHLSNRAWNEIEAAYARAGNSLESRFAASRR